MKKCLTLLFLSVFAIAMVFLRDAHACSCVGDTPSVLDEFERADHVVIAKITGPVKKREPVSRPEKPSYDIYLDMLEGSGADAGTGTAVMTVGKAYKGTLKPGEKIDIVHDFTSCDPVFDEKDIGREFLLYLVNPRINPPRFRMGGCGRPGEIESAAEDILYLENLSSVKGRTRISGRLINPYGTDISFVKKIIIHNGGKTWETAADSNGVYEIYDLPAGEYEIEPVLPDGWTLDTVVMHNDTLNAILMRGNAPTADPGRRLSATLSEGRHVSQDIYIIPANAIRGRLLSPSGKPLNNVLMNARRISENPGRDTNDGGATGRADSNGEFNLSVRNEGEYVLFVDNITATEDFPFGRLYYPGVADIEKAKVFSIKPGTFFDGLVFQVPKSEGLLKISATIQSAYGAKIANPIKTSLQFISGSGPDRKAFYADSLENGVFRINIPKGVSGHLSYSSSITTDNFRNCPEKLDEPFQPGRYTTIRTNEIWISGKEEADAMDVQLRVPAPCE